MVADIAGLAEGSCPKAQLRARKSCESLRTERFAHCRVTRGAVDRGLRWQTAPTSERNKFLRQLAGFRRLSRLTRSPIIHSFQKTLVWVSHGTFILDIHFTIEILNGDDDDNES